MVVNLAFSLLERATTAPLSGAERTEAQHIAFGTWHTVSMERYVASYETMLEQCSDEESRKK